MISPALATLQAPAQVPIAAVARLGATAATLLGASLAANAGLYADLLARLAAIADRAGPLLTAAIDSSAAEAELSALANAERVARAGEALFTEVARRASRRARVQAMAWARTTRRLWADIALTRREFAATAYLGVDWATAQPLAAVRILPGAEGALVTLSQDPLLTGADWDLPALAAALARWVAVT